MAVPALWVRVKFPAWEGARQSVCGKGSNWYCFATGIARWGSGFGRRFPPAFADGFLARRRVAALSGALGDTSAPPGSAGVPPAHQRCRARPDEPGGQAHFPITTPQRIGQSRQFRMGYSQSQEVYIPLATKNTPFRPRIFSPRAALQKLDVDLLCLRFCALLSTKIHAA